MRHLEKGYTSFNPKLNSYSFRQNHSSYFIQRRLDYFFVSNDLQEHVKKNIF